MKGQKTLHSSDRTTWETPEKLIKDIRAEFNITLDVCASSRNKKAPRYYNTRDNGLFQLWDNTPGAFNWMNPPYGKGERACKKNCTKHICKKRGHHIRRDIPGIEDWVEKANNEAFLRNASTVCLLPARTGTEWFTRFIWDVEKHKPLSGVEVRFLPGRLKFKGAPSSAPFESMIVIFKGGLGV